MGEIEEEEEEIRKERHEREEDKRRKEALLSPVCPLHENRLSILFDGEVRPLLPLRLVNA